MKLHGVVELTVAGEPVLRHPNLWDKAVKAFGGAPDLRTDKVRASLEATAIVEAGRGAMRQLGSSNAISLVIDDQVLFQDKEGRPDDFGDLFLAFHENAPVFGGSFRLLRLAAEHEEAGLHLVVETIARTEHPRDEPAARVVVSGRIREFEPRKGEDAESYRERVAPLLEESHRLEAHKRQFESFVSRLGTALRGALPEARVEVLEAEARVTKPAPSQQPAPPTSRHYDPYDHYYASPLNTMASVVLWSALLSSSHHHDVIVDQDPGYDPGDAGGAGDTGDGGDFADADAGGFDDLDFGGDF